MLEVLRNIGSRLLSELGVGSLGQTALARGAGGDRTYPVDRKAEEIILSALEATGEPMTAVSEEAGILLLGGGGAGRTVVIDPVDGSKNAVSGIPYYCSSIAVAEGKTLGDITHSYIVNLVNGDEFWAERHGGAFLNGKAITTRKEDVIAIVIYEAQNPGRDIPRILPLLSSARRTRCLGAVALDLACLASGAASVFAAPAPSRSFDFAGGWLMVREAGGIITDFAGKGLERVELGLARTSPVLASANAELHGKALEML